MNRKGLRFVSVFVTVLCVIGLISCAREEQLTSITIQPKTENFGATDVPVSANAGASVQLRAIGTYIHPPSTKDITDQVTWNSNTPDIATVSSAGLLTATGLACGGSLVSATVTTNKGGSNRDSSGAIATGYMTGNVICFVATPGPGLTVTFAGAGSGTVTSSPAGLGCASTCSANFPTGTTVTITATPTGISTFGSWSGCDSAVGQTCTVTLAAARSVLVTFN
jgi:hypothetical protein